MAKKKTFVLRINPEIYKQLEKWAADEFRSTNGQLEWIISRALKEAGRYPKKNREKILAKIESMAILIIPCNTCYSFVCATVIPITI